MGMNGYDVIRIVSQPAYLQAHAYRLRGPTGCVLIDPGAGLQTESILASLASEGLRLGDIRAVLLTHFHCDHALSAWWFPEHGIPVMAAAHTVEVLARAGHQVWYEHPELVRACPGIRVLADGKRLELAGLTITALATPGHTRGCMTYLVESAPGELSAITGDLLMPDGQPGWAGDPDEFSAQSLLESLRRLHDARPARAFPGHGSVNEPVSAWLERGMEFGRTGGWKLTTRAQAQAVPKEIGVG